VIPCLVLALLLAGTPDRYDAVVLTNGGTVRGSVLLDVPGENLVFELATGEVWAIPRESIVRVEYAPRAPQPEPGPPDGQSDASPDLPPTDDAPPDGAGPGAAPAASLAEVPALQAGVSMGLALPVGRLDASGLPLGSAVSPQLTFTFEVSVRAMIELELGLYLLVGVGTSYDPLNGYCLAAGAWCDAGDLGLGFFPRWSFLPRGALNPWIQLSGGLEWLSVWNEYRDSFDYFGWQVGAAAGLDLRLGGSASVSFQVGTRWGQFTSLTVTGMLPPIAFQPAMHGWIDLGIRANYGL
jgi:hypothetical protein